MMNRKLRVLARGTAMVFDYERHESGVRRFVGRKHDPSLGYAFKDDAGNLVKTGGWPPSHSPASPDSVPYRAEYLQALKDGDLWPADKETADYCGVPFDPTFGGEYDHLAAPAPQSSATKAVKES